ncbi:hypothetical protein ACFE04_003855 [Oxalis oulophora]
MKMLMNFIFVSFALVILVHAQDQSGFISLDCGTKKDTNYTEKTTGVTYISDADYVETGISFSVEESVKSTYQQQMWNLRSFPNGTRNCYSLNLTRGDRYLIRGNFLYGNYDEKNENPEFDIHIGPNFWATVEIQNSSDSIFIELIHVLSSDYLDVCLVDKGRGTPFISALELRLIDADIYETQIGSLQLYFRVDVGSNASRGPRYKEDIYDRYWSPYYLESYWNQTRVSESLGWLHQDDDFAPPLTAMRTTATPKNDTSPLTIYWYDEATNAKYFVYMYFAELEILQANETREFTINFNDDTWGTGDPYRPSYLNTTTFPSTFGVTSTDGYFTFNLVRTEISTHPPILNAMEVYANVQLSQSDTGKVDVDAIKNIKATYSLKRNWQGDPCAPLVYMWEGLNCSNLDDDPPRITSLNLSSSGLKGNIPHYISYLTSLQVLDLSNNNFTGSIPDFLSNLSSLTILNLENNKLNGSVPTKLLEKEKDGLKLGVEGNPDLCKTSSCIKKKKSNILVPVVAAIALVFVLIAVVLILVVILRRHRKKGSRETVSMSTITHESFEKKSQEFTYSEVLRISRNFERVIGKGGFGTVYYGLLDNIQVAVKMLSHLSAQGYKQFEAEVNLLLRVHHKNLTTLVGYCFDGTNMGLIYEFMDNGNLSENLSESSKYLLNWEVRLQIALEAALGLEYLHNGCKPPIIHRDVKSTNILLDDKFQAKLADFGLSRSFPTEGGTQLTTVVAGTPGYLDPEYYISNRLTEKSDVYSFGIVLMEIITSQPVIMRPPHSMEKLHITKYVSSMIEKGDVKSIVDPRLEGDFDLNTVWKVMELATACVVQSASRRPTMNEVVSELNECLETEKARKKGFSQNTQEFDSFVSMNLQKVSLSPLAR